MRNIRKFDTQTDYDSIKTTLPLPNICLLNDIYEIASEGDEDIIPIEYIKNNGSLYINTGVSLKNSKIGIETTFAIESYTNDRWPFGARDQSSSICDALYIGMYDNKISASLVNTDRSFKIGYGIPYDTNYHRFVVNCLDVGIQVDDYVYSQEQTSFGEKGYNMYLFGMNLTGSPYCHNVPVKIKNVKIYQNNNVLIRDFIPVRIGTVGYLFDNISKKLYTKATSSGSFILGPDIVPVEYLQSNGSAYIDSGIEATGDLSIECKFNQINSTTLPICGSIYNNGDGTYRRHHLYSQAYYYNNDIIMSFTGDNNFHICKVNVETGECYLDNVKKGTFTKSSFNCGANYGIFARISANMSLASKSSYFSWFKIWDKGVLVRDFISVRIGTAGYMYDKVSRQLFANAGTGSFVVGPDNLKIKLTRNK